MKYRVVLHHHEEGITVTVPGLPGCITEGDTVDEALDNAADAIQEYLTSLTVDLDAGDAEPGELREAREVEVAV